MNLPELAEALQMTWPAARIREIGPWRIRDGAGAGRRASAATPIGPVAAADIADAEAAMRRLPIAPLFAVRGDQPEFEALLDARGYRAHDHSIYYSAPIDDLTTDPPPNNATALCAPSQALEALWRANDISQQRINLMHRATCAKTAILGRVKAELAGAAFVGAHGRYALLHALVVDPAHRRSGLGRAITLQAAHWAAAQGCDSLSLAVSRNNTAAIGLYASLGMIPVGQYHYRSLPE